MGFFDKIKAGWNVRPNTGSGFTSFSLKQKTAVLDCTLVALIGFVLSIVAISSPKAIPGGSSLNIYVFAGGIIGVALSVLLWAHGLYLVQRYRRRITKNEKGVDWGTLVTTALTLLFSLTAVAVGS